MVSYMHPPWTAAMNLYMNKWLWLASTLYCTVLHLYSHDSQLECKTVTLLLTGTRVEIIFLLQVQTNSPATIVHPWKQFHRLPSGPSFAENVFACCLDSCAMTKAWNHCYLLKWKFSVGVDVLAKAYVTLPNGLIGHTLRLCARTHGTVLWLAFYLHKL